MNRLGDKERRAIDASSDVLFDVSGTMVKGNPAYGPITLISHYLRRGEAREAMSMGLNAARLYVTNKVRSFLNGKDSGNLSTIEEEYNFLDKKKVNKDLLEKSIEWYVNSRLFRQKHFEDLNEELKRRDKRVGAITFESSETAKAVKKRYGLAYALSNITKYFPSGTVNGIEYRMRTAEERANALEEEIGSERMKKAVVISNNEIDEKAFEGKVGLFMPFSRGKNSFNNFKEILKQLQNSD